jgi:hypothetical protein
VLLATAASAPVTLASMSVHVGAPAKCSFETECVVLPEQIHARVVFGHGLRLVFVVRRLGSLDGRDRLASHSSRWHECVDRERGPVLVPRL